jgi:glycosyltransferase involved in cell wall biosynthesis
MNGGPRVSVIISILNAERFLAETIESVFAQTFKNWELLLIDDGSTDDSAAMAQGYAAKYPQSVRYLEHYGHRRRGQGASRNLGIRGAAGEFVATLDHDDIWLPNKLERQVAILDAHPGAAMVYGSTQYWHSWEGSASGFEADYVQLPGIPANRVYEPPDLLKPILSEQITPPVPSDLMFRKKNIFSLGGFEESFIGALSMYEDQAFLVKVYTALPVFVSDECWDRYRIHPDQLCARVIRAGRKPDTEYFFLTWVLEYLEFQGIADAEIEAILRSRMWPHHHPFLNRLGAKARRTILCREN